LREMLAADPLQTFRLDPDLGHGEGDRPRLKGSAPLG
jgi:hypothetical protein